MLIEKKDRRILPRWRDFLTTVSLGELDSRTRQPALLDDARSSLAEKQADWDNNHTIWHAVDFIAASFVLGEPQRSSEAAAFVLRSGDAPEPALALARGIASNQTDHLLVPDVSPFEGEALYREIHRLKRRTVSEPRNAVAWVDLSRAYLLAGNANLARRAMNIACAISPDNRFVLRSATRFLVHQREALEAHRLLVNSPATRHDPWLMAAELGVATTARIGPVFSRPARSLIQSGQHPPMSLTELSSALATLELDAGKVPTAKKLFRQSLECPTENSLAQAEWASNHVSGLVVKVDEFRVPRSYEADALQSHSLGEWDRCFRSALQWLQDQPFSSRPAVLASYIGSAILQDYDTSIRLLSASLVTNPRHPTLINNLAFALANVGELDRADGYLSLLDAQDIKDTNGVTLLATQGLVKFKRGDAHEGRRLYLEAIAKSKKQGWQRYVAVASLYLAREEVLLNTSEKCLALHRAMDEAEKCTDKDVLFLLTRVLELTESSGTETTPP